VKSKKQRQEEKYQAIRLYNSNVISLQDLKSLFRITATVTDKEYSKPSDQKDALGTKDRLDRIEKLSRTRDAARQAALIRFGRKTNRLTANRPETIAQFALGYPKALPANWSRYGTLIGKGKRAKPRDGSSKGKIGKTTYRGFQRFNKNYDNFEKALLRLLESGRSKSINGTLKKIRDTVKTSVRR